MGKVYDPRKVTLMVDNMVVTGFAEDTMINMEKQEETNIPYSGAKGEITFTRNAHALWEMTVALSSESPFISILRDLALSDDPVFPISVVDMNENGQNMSSSKAIITNPPALMRGAEIDGVEIEIIVHDPDFN